MDSLPALLGEGREAAELTVAQVVARAVIVYGFTLACVRIGHKRLLNRGSAFDVVLAIVLGAIASRAINGPARLLPTFAGVAALVALHWVVAALTYHSPAAGRLFKGQPRLILRDGELLRDQMRRSHVSRHDVEESLRRAGLDSLDDAAQVILERDGELSVISRSGAAPRAPGAGAGS